MTNLTPSEARRLIDKLHHNQTKEHGISILEEKYLAALEIALTVLEQGGWKLVPMEPTPEMMVAGTLVSEFHEDPAGMYRAMIAAVSPQPKTDTYRQIENDGREG